MTASTDITALERDLISEISAAGDLAALEQVRIAALGKKGRVSELMAQLGRMAPDERKAFGQAVNAVKERDTGALDARKSDLEATALDARLATERVDVTLPVRPGPLADGRIHPVSQVYDEIIEIFGDMGFAVAEGPDRETGFFYLNVRRV
jgi:phenylalanyl-tRNA synthetase alpha chain